MPKRKSISVWLVMEDGENKGKIALQRRSEGNKHFPFVCQATWSGKIESNESNQSAIKRECAEELGEAFSNNFNFSELRFLEEFDFTEGKSEWTGFNYLGKISERELSKAVVHKGAFAEFVFLGSEEQFYDVSSGKDPKNNIILFNDQYNIVKKWLSRR